VQRHIYADCIGDFTDVGTAIGPSSLESYFDSEYLVYLTANIAQKANENGLWSAYKRFSLP
jgi:hypothetical protein